MIVLTPSTEQLNRLNGFTNKTSKLEFVPDGSGKLIVGLEVLNDTNFAEIHDQLNELERIEYTPNNDA
jgi:hypothetical protein